MDPQQSKVDDIYEKFTWKVDKFSCLKNTKEIFSEPFVLGGYPWRISLFPQGNNLSIYLEAVKTANMSEGWSRDVKFKLVVFTQFHSERTIMKETRVKFNEEKYFWGYKSFMPLAELNDPQKGFLVKDTCIVGVEVFVLKATNETQVSQATGLIASQTSGGPTKHTLVEVPRTGPGGQGCNLETLSPVPTLVCTKPTKNTDMELFSASIGEFMNFRGLGQIEEAFVPLLEEVCSHHPSLIECQQKRSRKFTGWAFNALGRVLYFLETKNVKDMSDQCCKDLQTLWEELETFEFDLAWLEPHVQSILQTRSYAEKVMQVEKLRENVVALELETERLRAKFVAAEANLDAERDFLKGKGFQQRDLDSGVGYRNWKAKGL